MNDGAVVRSLPPNPKVPGSIPGLVEGWISVWPSFPLKFTQLSILPRSVKWVPAYMGHIKAAAICAYMFFRSPGGTTDHCNVPLSKFIWKRRSITATRFFFFQLLLVLSYLLLKWGQHGICTQGLPAIQDDTICWQRDYHPAPVSLVVLTFQFVDLVDWGATFAVCTTSTWLSVPIKVNLRQRTRGAPAAILHRKRFVASLLRYLVTLLDGILAIHIEPIEDIV